MQITFGLLTNADGCPVAVEVFEGNTADPTTLSSVIAKLLPGNAGSYREMIVTRETSERPSTPGPIVLRGSFGLH